MIEKKQENLSVVSIINVTFDEKNCRDRHLSDAKIITCCCQLKEWEELHQLEK